MDKLFKEKITLIAINYEINSENISSSEQKLFQKLFEEEEIEDLNIKLSSKRRKPGGVYFVDFISTNKKTIKENLFDFFNSDIEDDSKFEEFKNDLHAELDEVLTKDDYFYYA